MASLLEMRFASEGEEDDTDYEESCSEEGTPSGSSSSSSDEEAESQQQRQPLYRRLRRSRLPTQTPAGETPSAAASAAAQLGDDATDTASALSDGRWAASDGASAAPAALREAAGTAREDPAHAGAAAGATAAAADEAKGQDEGELRLYGRKKIFSARQRSGDDRKHARTREQASSQHKARQTERLKASEIFKEMQEAEKQALRSYPTAVDPEDFLLQFHRRYPDESRASTMSWQRLQHHLSIAVSALRQPGPQAAGVAALQQPQPLPMSISPSPSESGAASAAFPVSRGAAAVGGSGVPGITEAVAARGHPGAAVAFSSKLQGRQQFDGVSSQQQQQLPAAAPAPSTERRCSDAFAAGASLLPSALLQQHRRTDAPVASTYAHPAACGDSEGEATTPLKQTNEEDQTHGPRLHPSGSNPAASGASTPGDPAAGGTAADAAAGSVQTTQQLQDSSCDRTSVGGTAVAPTTEDAAAAGRPSATAELSSAALPQSSPVAPAAASADFSIRECKKRCRKKLSNATLVKMMQEALHSMENAGDVSVKKVVRFAGQVIEMEETMEAASAKYQQMLELRRRVPQHIGGRFAGLDGLVAALDDPSSINSVQKSQADWEVYKREKGLAADLAKGHGFLQKQAFLAQTEWKQHEQNVEVRRKRQAEHRWAPHVNVLPGGDEKAVCQTIGNSFPRCADLCTHQVRPMVSGIVKGQLVDGIIQKMMKLQ